MSYEILRTMLLKAYDQATSGKGLERHAQGRDFSDQPIFQIQELLGFNGYVGPAFQAIKKIQEGVNNYSSGRFDYAALEKELLGAINYIAAILIHEAPPALCAANPFEESLVMTPYGAVTPYSPPVQEHWAHLREEYGQHTGYEEHAVPDTEHEELPL